MDKLNLMCLEKKTQFLRDYWAFLRAQDLSDKEAVQVIYAQYASWFLEIRGFLKDTLA
jgi:hypothetical protein